MSSRTLIILVALASFSSAQSVQVPLSPVAPGALSSAIVVNNTADVIAYRPGCALFVLTAEGDTTAISLSGAIGCDTVTHLSAGQQRSLPFLAPLTPGSYFLVFVGEIQGVSARAVTRLDVGNAAVVFPHVLACPSDFPYPERAHEAGFGAAAQTTWDLMNASSLPHVFGGSDAISITSPGGGAPLAGLSLSGVLLAPGGVLQIPLPTAALNPAPFTVKTTWWDPGTLGPRTVTQGVRAPGSALDLHFTKGRSLAPGMPLHATLIASDPGLQGGVTLSYAFLLGTWSGSLPVPGGQLFPLTLDPLMQATLTGDLGGLLQNHIGAIVMPSAPLPGISPAILLSHPGPLLGGLVVRAACLAYTPGSGPVYVSQPELITIL